MYSDKRADECRKAINVIKDYLINGLVNGRVEPTLRKPLLPVRYSMHHYVYSTGDDELSLKMRAMVSADFLNKLKTGDNKSIESSIKNIAPAYSAKPAAFRGLLKDLSAMLTVLSALMWLCSQRVFTIRRVPYVWTAAEIFSHITKPERHSPENQ